MKMFIYAATALLAAAPLAVTAQTAPGPSQSNQQPRDTAGMSPPATTTANGNLSGGSYEANAPGRTEGSGTPMASADGMTMKEGKWMMGDRPASKAEIAKHKRMMKHDKMAMSH